MKKSLHVLFAVMAMLVLLVSACAPATQAPTLPVPTLATEAATATKAATATDAPTATEAATATEAPTAVPPTATPPPPPVCNKLSDAPAAPATGKLGATDNPIVITFVPSGDTGKITKAG